MKLIFSNGGFPIRYIRVNGEQVPRYQIGSRYKKDGNTQGTMLLLQAPRYFERDWHRGINGKYAIIRRKDGKLAIAHDNHNNMCLVLTSRFNRSKLCNGGIKVLRNHNFTIASVVYAVDGRDPAYRWTELIVWARPGDAFYITCSTKGSEQMVVYFVDEDFKIHEVECNHLYNYCQKYRVEPPFTIDVSEGQDRAKLNLAEWKKFNLQITLRNFRGVFNGMNFVWVCARAISRFSD